MKKHLKDYFIPHEGNEYKPHSLQKVAMLGMVVLVVLSFTLANLQSLIWISSEWMVSTILPSVIVDLTNEERADDRLGVLKRNAVLDEAARRKAQDMADNEYFAHYSPAGVSPWYWFNDVSYNFVHAGENLAIHFTDSDEVVNAWMKSPTHRANIMNGNYAEIGVGTAEGTYEGFKTVYVVQLFGTPSASAAVAGDSTNSTEDPDPVAEAEEDPEETVVLAESVAITEDVTIVPSEPVPVVTEEPVLIAEAEGSSTEDEIISEMEITDHGVVLFSDLISTSTGGVPASIDPTSSQGSNSTPFFFELLTQPHMLLQLLYVSIGMFVVGSLLLSMLIEIRRQHPVQIAYGIGLLALMSGLFYMHTILSGGALIV